MREHRSLTESHTGKGRHQELREANGSQAERKPKLATSLQQSLLNVELKPQHNTYSKSKPRARLRFLFFPPPSKKREINKQTPLHSNWSFLTLITFIRLFSGRLVKAGLAEERDSLSCCLLTVPCIWLLMKEMLIWAINSLKAHKGLFASNQRKKQHGLHTFKSELSPATEHILNL